MMKRNVIFIFSAVFFILISSSYAATYYLDPNGTGDFPTIQEAINNCSDGDQIILTAGTYTGNGNRDIDFNGLAITIQSTNPDDPNTVATTIINCGSSHGNEYRGFYFHNQEDTNSVVSGLTITWGWGKQAVCPPYLNGYVGGAIYCKKSGTRIINCNIESNRSNLGPGAIYCIRSSVNIIDCVISKNYSTENGIVFCMDNSNLNIKGCSIFANKNRPAVRSDYTNMLNIENSIIAGNQSGGIYCDYSTVNIANVVITANRNNYIEPDAEALRCSESDISITNSIIWDNNSPDSVWEGAIRLTNNSTAMVRYSDIQYGKEGIWADTPKKVIRIPVNSRASLRMSKAATPVTIPISSLSDESVPPLNFLECV